MVLFGEIFGVVGGFDYGSKSDEILFRAFDIWDANKMKFLDTNIFEKICNEIGVPMVPVEYRGSWLGLEYHKPLAEGKSSLADHIREGIVVRLETERNTVKGQRVHYKLPGVDYLLKKGRMK